jgi:hypothetical protein
MKHVVATFCALALGLTGLFAGEYYPKQVIVPPDLCECYPPGVQLGGHGAAYWADNGDPAYGGGINLAYFFTEKLGLELSYSVFDTDPSEEHLITLDVIYRLFIDNATCLSPYLIGGGGLMTNSENEGVYRAGVGLEWRFEQWNCLGIFADGTYNWIGDQDGPVARLGVRIPW